MFAFALPEPERIERPEGHGCRPRERRRRVLLARRRTTTRRRPASITLPDGKKIRRSYGSMSYALLKTYLFCNIDLKDPRVQARGRVALEELPARLQPRDGGRERQARGEVCRASTTTTCRWPGRSAAARADVLKDEAGKPRNWRRGPREDDRRPPAAGRKLGERQERRLLGGLAGARDRDGAERAERLPEVATKA